MRTKAKTEDLEQPEFRGFRDTYLLFQLAFVSHMFSEDFHAHLRELGISPSKWRLLVNIYERPDIPITLLAKHALYEQSRVTKLVDQLCAEGLAVKSVGKEDRRKVLLNLTAKGEAVLTPLIAQALHHEEQLLSELESSDVKLLKSILSKLVTPRLQELDS